MARKARVYRLAAPGVVELARLLESEEIIRGLVDRHNKIASRVNRAGFRADLLRLTKAIEADVMSPPWSEV